MATATPLQTMPGYPGTDATLYRLDPPMRETDDLGNVVREHEHVVVWTTPAQPHVQAEGKLVAAHENGASLYPTMRALVRYGHDYAPNHAGVLWLAGGYEIAPGQEATR